MSAAGKPRLYIRRPRHSLDKEPPPGTEGIPVREFLRPSPEAKGSCRSVLRRRHLVNFVVLPGVFVDLDAYLRPLIHYKIDDYWSAEAGGNLFFGEDDYTFFGQFEKNSNLYIGIRYGF